MHNRQLHLVHLSDSGGCLAVCAYPFMRLAPCLPPLILRLNSDKKKKKTSFPPYSPLIPLSPALQLHSSFNIAFCENLKKRVDSFDKKKRKEKKEREKEKKKRPLHSKG